MFTFNRRHTFYSAKQANLSLSLFLLRQWLEQTINSDSFSQPIRRPSTVLKVMAWLNSIGDIFYMCVDIHYARQRQHALPLRLDGFISCICLPPDTRSTSSWVSSKRCWLFATVINVIRSGNKFLEHIAHYHIFTTISISYSHLLLYSTHSCTAHAALYISSPPLGDIRNAHTRAWALRRNTNSFARDIPQLGHKRPA